MANYYLNEAALELPERPFTDNTIHALEAKLPGGKTLGVFVHRRPVEPGKSLAQLVDDNLELNAKRLSAFDILEKAEASVGGIPGLLLRTSWRHTLRTREQAEIIFYQLQAHVVLGENWLIFAASAPIEEQAAADETFQRMLETLTWRTE